MRLLSKPFCPMLLLMAILGACVPAMRTDRAPQDAPWTNADLARNFADIAFVWERTWSGTGWLDQPAPHPLMRWEGTLRVRVAGDAATAEDRAAVATLLAEIRALTGLAAVLSDGVHDMLVSIGPGTQALARAVSPALAERHADWLANPTRWCMAVLGTDPTDVHRITYAHVMIPAYATGLARLGCLDEEIVQSLGLTADSPRARPSIFNDDGEFARLTHHDRALLGLLYAPRLSPGMTRAEAMPIVREILALD